MRMYLLVDSLCSTLNTLEDGVTRKFENIFILVRFICESLIYVRSDWIIIIKLGPYLMIDLIA